MAEGAFLLLVLLVGVGAPLVLYALVREERERDRETVAGWNEAERAARKDDGGSEAARPDGRPGNRSGGNGRDPQDRRDRRD